ncbi:MAG: zinc-binding dehydrogenase [Kiritimatiellae bacterium]|nr:zinc-binding dehydrogenase [Kiritimatiellia bacterium]
MEIKKAKAAILVESHKPLIVAEVMLPDELLYGQVLVKVHYSGICGSQIGEIEAVKGDDKYLPHLLGHEGSATVIDAGAGVKTVKHGDNAVMHWMPGEGVQAEPPIYYWNGRRVNAGWVTTFNEYAVVSENRLTVIPSDFDLKLAPLFGCAITTALGVVNNDAQLKIGQSVVVFGVGGIGLNIVQGAEMVSAHPVIAIDIVDSKLEKARQFGATYVFNSRTVADLETEIRKIVGSKGADVVIETTGNTRVIEQAYGLTHPNGRTILVGVPKKGDNASIYTLPLHFKKVLKGSHGGSTAPHVDIPNYLRLVQSGKLKLDGLITHEFTLAEINKGIELMKAGHGIRVLIDMESA